MKPVSVFHLLRRAPVVCTLPPQSTQLAIDVDKLIRLGVNPSDLPIAALEELTQRPGVLATPRDVQLWAEMKALHGSKTLRAALEGFASTDAPISHNVVCRLLNNCIGLRLREHKHVVNYLARHLRNVQPATLTAGQCITAICGLVSCQHPETDPLYATLVARIKEEGAACKIKLLVASAQCAALRPLFTPAFIQGVLQDLRAGVYKPHVAASILLVLGSRGHWVRGDTVRNLCNAMWRSHSQSRSMRPGDRFKLIEAGGNIDEMRRSLSERSAEYLMVVPAKEIHYVVARRWWDVGALQTTLEAALLLTVPRLGQRSLLKMLEGQVDLKRFNVPLTDAVAEALGPERIPLGLACTALCVSGYNNNEGAIANPRPFIDAVLAARSVAFRELTCGRALCHLIETLVVMRNRGNPDALVGDALAATAAWVASREAMPSYEAMMLVSVRNRRLTHNERRTLQDTIITPMYRRIIKGLPTAAVRMAAVAFILAPLRDRGRIGQRLVAVTGNHADAFRGIPTHNVLWLALGALSLPSPIDAAHINRHFTHWCRTRSQLSPTQSVVALCLLTMAPRVSPTVLRKIFIDVRNMVTFLDSNKVTQVLVAMAKCHCVDTALLSSLMSRALAIAPSWQDNDIAPAILAMAHLRVVCRPVFEALVRRLRTFPVEVQRRCAPKVVEALSSFSRKHYVT